MTESLRDVEITVVIDTNKQTYIRKFEDIDEAKQWHDEMIEEIR